MALQTSQTESNQKNGYSLEKKIDLITNSLSRAYYKNILIKLAERNTENANILCDYIIAEQTEINIKNSTKESRIKVLVWLSNFFEDKISFQELTKQDILNYLNGLRKSIFEDESQRWIGSYNARQIILNKFFRWLYNSDEPHPSKRITPKIMNGIKQLQRKEKTLYKNSDLWIAKEHSIFLKYCPSKRDKAFHAIANDTSARPHELLNLKIKDIVFKITEDRKQYAELHINGGKTGSRTVPLIDSIPYLKDYLQNEHPTPENQSSWLFVSATYRTFGNKLSYDGLRYKYSRFYKTTYFPNLLNEDNETIPEVDKAYIKNMLTKPWNLYIFRHGSLTEKSQVLKEHVLRNHAGWTMGSKMPQIYLHYLGNESVNSLLEIKGILNKDNIEKFHLLQSTYCPNCNEPNKLESKFCGKCKMVLSYDSYTETIEKQKEKDGLLKKLVERQEKDISEINSLKVAIQDMQELLKHPEKLMKL
jgi:integrase